MIKSVLNDAQRKLVAEAILHGTPILIDGDRSKATGKSTLCDALRVLGAEVYEVWELEEGKKHKTALSCSSS